MPHDPITEVITLLALSVVAVALLRRVNLPPILGYLFVGIIAGPNALGWLPDSPAIHLLGEAGVIFLRFMIGLEISIGTDNFPQQSFRFDGFERVGSEGANADRTKFRIT